jgi:LCP family protein required for cell wall assembly
VPAKKAYSKSRPEKKSVAKSQRQAKKKSLGSLLLMGLGLAGVAMLSATAGAILAVSLSATPLRQTKLTPEQAAIFRQDEAITYSNLRLPELSRPINILVLGTKVLTTDLKNTQAETEKLGYQALVNSFDGLTDTMLLVRFEPETRKMTVLSLPRDTQVTIPGRGVTKINEANVEGGPALTAETVSNLLNGVTIDRYVRVNVQGVEKLIDALGGVTVYVPRDMKYQDDSQHLYINLKAGKQHLDGAKAQQFLRFRYDEYGDIGRVQRQQMLMRAIVEQALKPQILLKIPEILSAIQSHVDTNLNVEELVALAGFASQSKRGNVQMLMLPGGFNGDGRNGVSYWLPNQQGIEKMVAQHFAQGYNDFQFSEPSSLSIAIQDSTDDPEAVRAMVRLLRKAGYTNVYVSRKWKEPLKVTRIVAQKGDDGAAAAVRASVGVGEVLVESTGALTSDITIQLGQDWRQNLLNSKL